MRCDFYKENLMAFMDGELSERDRTELELHLSRCEDCKRELQTLREISGTLKRSQKALELNPGFDQRFFQKLAAERERQTSKKGWLWEWLWERSRWRVPVAVTASVVVVMMGYFLSRQVIPFRTDFQLAHNLELMENLEVVRNMDLLEDLDVLESYDLYQ